MHLNDFKAFFIIFLAFSIATTSCTSAKFQQGFSYHPAVEGPSIGSNQSNDIQIQPKEDQQRVVQPIAEISTIEIAEMPIEFQELKTARSPEHIDQGEVILEKTTSPKQTVQQLITNYAEDHHIAISSKQQRYINKVLTKIEHKATFKSIIWEPQTNVEIFFLMGAGVGLLVGLLGNGLGWFIFLIMSLAYLYFKLLLD